MRKAFEKGIEKGRGEANVDVILKGHDNKLKLSMLSNLSGISESQVFEILKKHGRIK